MNKDVTIAIVQLAPEFLDLDAGLDKALQSIEEAADKGANLIVFGESWLTGYPAWLDHVPNVALWDHEPTKEVFLRMRKNSVVVPSEVTDKLASAAKQFDIAIVIGINERVDFGPGNGTLYNSLLIFNENGELANHHRKLIPTYTERMLYGQGDAKGLKAVDTKIGRVGGCICWEHWMPLTRQALHDSGEHIHVALWPTVHEMHQIASRQYAFEGRCFVVAVGQILSSKQFPTEFGALPNDEPILRGGSCVIGPNGTYVLEPSYDNEAILYASIDLSDTEKEKLTLDVSGHYSRPDVFKFEVNAERK